VICCMAERLKRIVTFITCVYIMIEIKAAHSFTLCTITFSDGEEKIPKGQELILWYILIFVIFSTHIFTFNICSNIHNIFIISCKS
jgi:hypothetical protein